MRKVLIWSFSILFGIIIILFLVIKLLSEPIPKSIGDTKEAEALTDRLLTAINYPAYDSLALIEWSFPRGHHFVWEKKINRVTVEWDEIKKVIFFPNTLEGEAYVDGKLVGEEGLKDEMIQKAWALFANDSFWLVAPFKVRDPGTVRSIVQTDEGVGLLVTYLSGGVTPGDSYLWILDEQYRPMAWKMWVKIIPIGGLKFMWESGQYYKDIWFAPSHSGPGGYKVDLVIHQIQ